MTNSLAWWQWSHAKGFGLWRCCTWYVMLCNFGWGCMSVQAVFSWGCMRMQTVLAFVTTAIISSGHTCAEQMCCMARLCLYMLPVWSSLVWCYLSQVVQWHCCCCVLLCSCLENNWCQSFCFNYHWLKLSLLQHLMLTSCSVFGNEAKISLFFWFLLIMLTLLQSHSPCHSRSCRTQQNARHIWSILHENVVYKAMLRSFLSRDMASETKHGILVSVDSMLLQCWSCPELCWLIHLHGWAGRWVRTFLESFSTCIGRPYREL